MKSGYAISKKTAFILTAAGLTAAFSVTSPADTIFSSNINVNKNAPNVVISEAEETAAAEAETDAETSPDPSASLKKVVTSEAKESSEDKSGNIISTKKTEETTADSNETSDNVYNTKEKTSEDEESSDTIGVSTASNNGSSTAVSASQLTDTAITSIVGSGSAVAGTFMPLQGEKYDNLDEDPVLNGGEVRFLYNEGSAAQQLSAVFKSSDGKVIVVDGGQKADEEHLVRVIKEMGGRVDAWLITHPQTDHVSALIDILDSGRSDISIENVYYNFLEQSWYNENDPDECAVPANLKKALARLDDRKLHSSAKKGDEVKLSSSLSFKVLNSPVRSSGIFAGNGAGLMYDICIDGKHFIILGDMPAKVGDDLMDDGVLDGVKCDFVQISHHGQAGVSDDFYKALNPTDCIWPTNSYIYNAKGSEDSGLATTRTKMCISKLPVKHNYLTLGRDVIIK